MRNETRFRQKTQDTTSKIPLTGEAEEAKLSGYLKKKLQELMEYVVCVDG